MAEKMVPGSHNWLEVVVDSVKSGSKNGSSLPVLRGTMPGQIINWLGVVADLCHWEASLVSCWAMEEMSCAVGWRRMHGRLTSAKPFLWRHQPVGEPMVHRCRLVLRDHAKKCSELALDCRGFCKRWHQKWFLSASSSWAHAGVDY